MKRLFILKNNHEAIFSNEKGEPYYFESKADAKAVRNEENNHRSADRALHISLGPDHWRA